LYNPLRVLYNQNKHEDIKIKSFVELTGAPPPTQ